MKDIESFQADNRNSDMVAIEINNLTKRFGNFTAIDGLTLTVKYGEIFGLLGPNGSGKTTTINIVSGLSKPTYGQVIVLGHDIMKNTRSVHAALGAVPQETALYEELSAWTNMSVHADLYRVGGVVVRAHEIDTYFQDTGYIQYIVVSLMVVSIMLGGLLQAGSNAARE